MARPILYKCPHTGMNVQHSLPVALDDEPKSTYSSVFCPACSRLHLIDGSTGKLLPKTRASSSGGPRGAI
jgi:hypothetical protein